MKSLTVIHVHKTNTEMMIIIHIYIAWWHIWKYKLGRKLPDNLASIDSVNQSLTLTRKLFRRSDPQQRYMMFEYKCLFTNCVVVNEYVKKSICNSNKTVNCVKKYWRWRNLDLATAKTTLTIGLIVTSRGRFFGISDKGGEIFFSVF